MKRELRTEPLRARTLVALGLLVAASCTTAPEEPAPRTPASAPTVRAFGKWPTPNQEGRIGTSNAPQSFTPAAHPKAWRGSLRSLWTARVGRTDARTTMVLQGGAVVVGTHGGSATQSDEAGDAVYVLDARTGAVRHVLGAQGHGDRDVDGVAVDGGDIFFTTDVGEIVAGTSDGAVRWRHATAPDERSGEMTGPALADVDGDSHVEVVVGDRRGALRVLDGGDGHLRWSLRTKQGSDGGGIYGAPAVADVDGDGLDDLIFADGAGTLISARGRDGKILWATPGTSPLRSAPVLVDLDGDGRFEVLAGWSNGTVSVLDLATGLVLWSQHLESDRGAARGLLASAVALPGVRVGSLLAATSTGDGEDGLVVLSEHARAFRAKSAAISATPIVWALTASELPDGIVGTPEGELVALDARGGRTWLANVGAPVASSALAGDVDGDGTVELLVADDAGVLHCYSTGSTARPALARYRGDLPHNRGESPPVYLGWTFARGRDAKLGLAR